MNSELKKFLKEIFPMGILVAVHRFVSGIKQNFLYFPFLVEWKSFKALSKKVNDQRFQFSSSDLYPILHEKTAVTYFDRHYIYHPAWAARKIAEIKPSVHTDISSTLHFCTQLSAFIPVKFYDYRPADIKLSNLTSDSADLLQLPFDDNSIASLSCMHTIEHIGLGRYGDPLDPTGDVKAMKELQRVLAAEGSLLFVVPVGKPRVMFNAHRVYSYELILQAFNKLRLKEFSLLPDEGYFIENANPALVSDQNYGCGCFLFTK